MVFTRLQQNLIKRYTFCLIETRKHWKIHSFGFQKATKPLFNAWLLALIRPPKALGNTLFWLFERSHSLVKCMVLAFAKPENNVKDLVLALTKPQNVVK